MRLLGSSAPSEQEADGRGSRKAPDPRVSLLVGRESGEYAFGFQKESSGRGERPVCWDVASLVCSLAFK